MGLQNKLQGLLTQRAGLDANLTRHLQKSILQQAIEGKLVPQIAEEGTAQELLEQIRQEKQKLVKEGKLKKSALNYSVIFKGDDNKYYERIGSQIAEIEIPFDIPDSWQWVRGTTAFLPMTSTKPSGEKFIYIDLDAIDNKTNNITKPKFLWTKEAPSRATRELKTGDVLFSLVRPYLKNIAIIPDNLNTAIASTGFYVIRASVGYSSTFLFWLMMSPYVVDGLNQFMKGDNSPSINNTHIEQWLYPLPPLQEQQRIVTHIVNLFEQLR